MSDSPWLGVVLLGLLELCVGMDSRSWGSEPHETKAIIEFGWDEPDTAFLRDHHATMEQTPFDGCVFHVLARKPEPDAATENLTWLVWGSRAFTRVEVRSAVDDLKAIPWKRFRHNFLRFNTTPANLDWFDDHASVLINAELAAWVAREGKARGILLDVEQYQGQLFHYAKQRDASTRSFEDYAKQAGKRGQEVMRAFQTGYPGLTVFLTFGPTLPLSQRREGTVPLKDCEYGLLLPFIDGMIAAVEGDTRIVDGHELSYGWTDPARFAPAATRIKDQALQGTSNPARSTAVISAGFGLWLDYDWRSKGWNESDPTKNYFSPMSFEASLTAALKAADHYVWIYTETPRWWTPRGGTERLPTAYIEAIRRARDTVGRPAR